MKELLPPFLANNRFVNAALFVAVTIVLGAIGSGLWERFLGPVYDSVSSLTLTAIGFAVEGYLDHLYGDVPRDPTFRFLGIPTLLVLISLIAAPWFVYSKLLAALKQVGNPRVSSPRALMTYEELRNDVERVRRKAKYIYAPVFVIASVVYSETLFQLSHAVKAERFVLRSIDIVAPVIQPHDVLTLKARFAGIETAADFYALEDALRNLAALNNLRLPEFESIR